MISSSPSPPSSSSAAAASRSGSSKPPPQQQASKWRSGTQHKIYGRRLLDALRATGGGQPRAVKAAADSALALTARGQTRWSRAILLAGAACSRRRVLVKAGGKIRRRHRRPQHARSKAAAFAGAAADSKEGGKVQERLRVLGRLVPGCRKLPAPELLEEAVDYVAALQMQVNTMRALADALAAAQLSDAER
ncbi:transcription factor bHLH150-like [Panicum virgatum]|uniref:BHLH domain-containing protein n=1 Tax=Panicum virgatum TaxID=38727 RepID=A0A8T0NDZ9_PANVG|nr:transcription factor bHLH150-like [Panicum virgatum]KAG2546402.1 hypothetical protein PVAP13_9KG030670 [Panicum virgatum]